jgi:transcriptional regulator with XRE-family HTH domain
MGHELTTQQERVYELRTLSRLSFTQIGAALGITRQTAHTNYYRALAHIRRYEQELGADVGTPLVELDRQGEIEFVDATLQRYLKLADKAEGRSPRSAAEILNGASRWFDMLIKIKGMAAPVQIQHKIITDHDLEQELIKIEQELAELGIEDAEIVGEIEA